MKNNFDLKNYMKENKVGSYQQLNEMWYQDINQALGDFNVIKEEAIEETPLHPDTEEEDENGNTYFTEDEVKNNKIEWTSADFSPIAGIKVKKGDKGEIVSHDTDNQYLVKFNNHKFYAQKAKDFKGLEEMGGVKTIGDAGKMATPNSRPNLGRHRSSDMLDKMSKKDHKTNTVVGAKAAAYKAPHMKEDEFKSFGDPDLTLNDLNNNIVITPFELEKTWKDVYGEDFKTEYSGAHSYLSKNYKNFTIADLVDVWERMYGEDFLQEYSGIAKWLFSNQGKTSSKDKVAPKMNEDESEKEKAMYANTDPNIADPINQDDDIFAGSEKADWNGKAERMDWEKDLVGKEVGNWKSDIEQQAGSISWTSEKYPNAIIYATPGWEGVDGIAVEVHESEEGFMDEPKLQKVVAAGTDLWKTKEGYLALMAKIFTTLEKMLTPAEMTEDHGTQINHDMNDDISTDHTEPEHMVQNEDADPFGSIKGGIDKITMGDDDMDMSDDDRMMSLGGDRIKAGIESLMADGFDYREILQFVKDTIAAKRNY